MANAAPVEPEAPRPWYAGLIGFVVVALVLGAAALATAASYDGDDDHGAEHSEAGDHSEDDDGEHSEEEDDHSEDE